MGAAAISVDGPAEHGVTLIPSPSSPIWSGSFSALHTFQLLLLAQIFCCCCCCSSAAWPFMIHIEIYIAQASAAVAGGTIAMSYLHTVMQPGEGGKEQKCLLMNALFYCRPSNFPVNEIVVLWPGWLWVQNGDRAVKGLCRRRRVTSLHCATFYSSRVLCSVLYVQLPW